MYSVTWPDSNGKQQTKKDIPLIQMAVDVLASLDDDMARECALVTDNNPQTDVTTYAFELLIDRFSSTEQNNGQQTNNSSDQD